MACWNALLGAWACSDSAVIATLVINILVGRPDENASGTLFRFRSIFSFRAAILTCTWETPNSLASKIAKPTAVPERCAILQIILPSGSGRTSRRTSDARCLVSG